MKSSLSAHPFAVFALAATLLLSGGCRKADEAPSSERAMETPAALPTAASSADLTGIWTVIGHRIPGISAMSDTEATAWYGRTVRLTATQAMSGENRCDEPRYATRTVTKDHFLSTDFNLPPASLAPLASLERLTLLEVSCDGVPWAAMGGLLLEIDADRVLSPWDGVFFELARDRDFRAAGQEPFWHLDIRQGKEIRFTYALGEAEAIMPAPKPETDPQSGVLVYRAMTEANDLRVVIEPAPCTDVMSGKPFETTVTVALNGQIYRGCGGTLP